jgi:predicted aconitase with swiveling domain
VAVSAPIVIAGVVIAGTGRGRVLRLAEPLSFWGGVDPATARLSDPRGARAGESIAGRVLMLPATRGSSSSSAVMLELIAGGRAPAAIVLGTIDAILGLGIIVGREMGYPAVPLLLLLPAEQQAQVADGAMVAIAENGEIRAA